MSDWQLAMRRLLLVFIAILIAAPILRPAMASALITRGDALLYARDSRAKEKYRLALAFDASNIDAADRYVFVAFLSHRTNELKEAIDVASSILAHYPRDTALRMDRALCSQLLKRYAAAEADFERVGRESGDVQALALAAADAKKLGHTAAARRLLLEAYRIDPAFAPLRIALARGRK